MSESYSDIPIITDAELVVEGEQETNATPPPSNPDYVAVASRQQNEPPKAVMGVSTVSKSSGNGTMVVPAAANYLSSPSNYNAVAVSTNTSSNNNSAVSERPKMYRNLGRNATGLLCPHCHRQTVTAVDDVLGVGTVVAVILIAILFWPLCWLPLCVPSCKRTNHYCGHHTCGKKVGETHVCA